MTQKDPEPTVGDLAHTIAKAGLSMIPVIGGPAAELFQYLVQSPLERRRTEWMIQVGEKLLSLEEKGLRLEDLKSNENFVTALVQASAAAVRTHKQEKLAALRNAVANIAAGQGPDETLQHLLLSFIDEFSEMHLRVLSFAHSPVPPPNISAGGLGHVLEDNIPDLRGRRGLYDQLWKDLYLRGLINTDSLHVMMTGHGLGQSRTTDLGNALLSLISAPQNP